MAGSAVAASDWRMAKPRMWRVACNLCTAVVAIRTELCQLWGSVGEARLGRDDASNRGGLVKLQLLEGSELVAV